MYRKLPKKAKRGAALLLPLALFTATASAADIPGQNTPTGFDQTHNCVYNGFNYIVSGDIAQGPHCFTTPDNSTIPKLGTVDNSKTQAQLDAVQNSSPLSPSNYMAAGTMATRLVGDAPRASNSKDIAAFVKDMPAMYLPAQFKDWLRTGSNIGGGVSANDNIPIYMVDSSNPHQEYRNFTSSDGRVTNYPKLVNMTTGKIPLPSWAKASDGGDHSLAVYDTATGILRAYFHATPVTGKETTDLDFSASAYLYMNPKTQKLGDQNYWMGYLQGSSSVIGMSNELTQIGADEVKAGQINHMVSVTFPSYAAGKASFPAKQTDGQLDPTTYPNAPQAGQVFTFPKDMDIDAYAKANGIDDTTKAIMKAVQKYGGIVSDRNAWCMAFNFENPYGMGATASKGLNAYKEDSVLAAKINAMNINKFPWGNTEWLPANYAGHLTNAVTPPAPAKPQPKLVDDTIYLKAGTTATVNVLKNDSPGTGSKFNLNSFSLLDESGKAVNTYTKNGVKFTASKTGLVTVSAAKTATVGSIHYSISNADGVSAKATLNISFKK